MLKTFFLTKYNLSYRLYGCYFNDHSVYKYFNSSTFQCSHNMRFCNQLDVFVQNNFLSFSVLINQLFQQADFNKSHNRNLQYWYIQNANIRAFNVWKICSDQLNSSHIWKINRRHVKIIHTSMCHINWPIFVDQFMI